MGTVLRLHGKFVPPPDEERHRCPQRRSSAVHLAEAEQERCSRSVPPPPRGYFAPDSPGQNALPPEEKQRLPGADGRGRHGGVEGVVGFAVAVAAVVDVAAQLEVDRAFEVEELRPSSS